MTNKAVRKYLVAKRVVIEEGYGEEINWQANLCFDDINESTFMRELAWVVLSSGMRERVVRNLFDDISRCFFNWVSAEIIVANEDKCFHEAIRYFNNGSKISAIIKAAKKINSLGFSRLKMMIRENPIETLQDFSYIGPITVYHLAKNIGLPVAKPDRHLTRIANMEGYSDVQEFCNEISRLTGDGIAVVDIVLWRFATINSDYLNSLSFFDNYCEVLKKSREGSI